MFNLLPVSCATLQASFIYFAKTQTSFMLAKFRGSVLVLSLIKIQ